MDASRRALTRMLAGGMLGASLGSSTLAAQQSRQILSDSRVEPVASDSVPSTDPASDMLTRPIPSSGEQIPIIGMGTWITFDLPPHHPERPSRVAVFRQFLRAGGGMVDSSPMYGHAEALLGHAIARAGAVAVGRLFAASKIWTPLAFRGTAQMANSERLWGVTPMDLMQVHNLVDWERHLPQLREWRDAGRIRYLGITTSHGRRHDRLEMLLRREALDTVQLTYNARDREAERRLLPLARDRGIAVIANRPLQRGALVHDHARRPLPVLARELGCRSWAQFFLLYAVSHPDITCVIPATGVVDHVAENMAVGALPMPDATTRREMLAYID